MRRGAWLLVSAIIALLGVASCAQDAPAQWPSRPVRLIVPFGAGTGTDLTARLFAPLLSERWGVPVLVDNRPGGDSIIGMQAFVASDDGHTLLFAPGGSVTVVPLQHEQLPFDPAEDVVPVAAATRLSMGIAATKSLGVSSLAELVAAARSQPGKYRWAAAPGVPELIFSAFLQLEGLDMTHVAYRDLPNALRDLAAGRIHVMAASVTTMTPQLQMNAARLIAVTSSERSRFAPSVPTVIEAGYPALAVDSQWGFFGWRGMPEELRARIAEDIRITAADAALVARLAAMGQVADAGSAAGFGAEIARQRAQIAAIARMAEGQDVRIP
jgi:tripartite-type tricarboxylate transporter receptor subunit TctC